MKSVLIILLPFAYSCSQVSKRPTHKEPEMVSLNAALDHARSSYLKGCVDTYHVLKIPKSFESCVIRAKIHEEEIRSIMSQLPVEQESSYND